MMEKPVFIEFFGDYPIVRVIDFLVTFRRFDYNRKDIARNANVSWNTLKTFWKKLVKRGVVVKTRKVGKSQMYKLDEKSQLVKELLEFNKALLLESMKGVGEKEIEAIASRA